MKIHCIVHEAFEGPGYLLEWARARGYNATLSRVYLDEPLPVDSDDFDLLVVLGGPQSPATSLMECAYFDSKKEQALIRQAIDSQKMVVGFCLGAQLIGEALGAHYHASPNKEIGFFDIVFTKEAGEDPHFSDFPGALNVGHWHSDMPGLTPEACVLAHSQGCPRQIIRYQKRVYGFQCHLELVPTMMPDLIDNSRADMALNAPYIQSADIILSKDTQEMNQFLARFLDSLVSSYRRD